MNGFTFSLGLFFITLLIIAFPSKLDKEPENLTPVFKVGDCIALKEWNYEWKKQPVQQIVETGKYSYKTEFYKYMESCLEDEQTCDALNFNAQHQYEKTSCNEYKN